jgi:fermentation-respiration switch protein FrsA (DUF1100 family)
MCEGMAVERAGSSRNPRGALLRLRLAACGRSGSAAARPVGLLVACGIVVITLFTWGAKGMWSTLQRKMIFFPTSVLEYTPADLGLAYEDIRIRTADGVTVHGWMVPCEGSQVTLLFFHGNAGNIGDRVENVKRLHEVGIRVFILDYRGYGHSEGSPSEKGLYEDAQAAYAYLLSRADVHPGRIAVFGRSLGGAVAVDLASRVPCWKLIVESTFTSAADMAGQMLPFLPMSRLITERFDSAAKIGKVRAPLLQFHGTQDEIVPFHLGRRLHELAPEPKEFVPIPGATHNDTYLVGGKPYFEKIRSFLTETPVKSKGS